MVLWIVVSYMISLLFYATWFSTQLRESPAAYSTYTFSNLWGSDMDNDEDKGEVVDLTVWREERGREKMEQELRELWDEFVHVTDQLAAYGDAGALKESILDSVVDLRQQVRTDVDFDDAWGWNDYDQYDEDEDREPDY